MPQPRDQKFTYADYLTWSDAARYELIDGDAYMMAPAPSPEHQTLLGNLFVQFHAYLKGKTCQAFIAPFDVRLSAQAEDDTVVQPDLTLVCDPGKLDARGCRGVPDMIVEILSPSSLRHDQVTKFNKYRDAGVREYWIVSPDARGVMVYRLEDGKYIGMAYGDTDTIAVHVLEDCAIRLDEVFPPAPPEEAPRGPESTAR